LLNRLWKQMLKTVWSVSCLLLITTSNLGGL
jgi:hypothetical protein